MNLKVGMKFDNFDEKKWELFRRLSQDVLDGDLEAEAVLADFLEEEGITHWDMGAEEHDSMLLKIFNVWAGFRANDSILLKVLKVWGGFRAIHMPYGLKKLLADEEVEKEKLRALEDVRIPRPPEYNDEWDD